MGDLPDLHNEKSECQTIIAALRDKISELYAEHERKYAQYRDDQAAWYEQQQELRKVRCVRACSMLRRHSCAQDLGATFSNKCWYYRKVRTGRSRPGPQPPNHALSPCPAL